MAYIQPESHIPRALEIGCVDLEAARNSYPLYMFDNDARCHRCGGELCQHHYSRRYGHRVGYCPACRLLETLYDTAGAAVWPKVKHIWQRGVPLDRSQVKPMPEPMPVVFLPFNRDAPEGGTV